MPRQPSTLFAVQVQQQPFTLVHEYEAWHVTFPGHRCELDVHGSRIEAQAIARCYYSLFLASGAPFAHAGLSECEQLDLAEREAAIARYNSAAWVPCSTSPRAMEPYPASENPRSGIRPGTPAPGSYVPPRVCEPGRFIPETL